MIDFLLSRKAIASFSLVWMLGLPLPAQAESFSFQMNGGKIVIPPEQQIMLEASQKVMERDFPAALSLYNRVLAVDGDNIQAYIQRGVVRREMGDEAGSRQDGLNAAHLSEAGLARDPQNAKLYYQRGTAYRLLKDFPKAKENIQYAIYLSGDHDWEADLQAIALEEKIGP